MKSKVLAPVHPGKILIEEFVKPLNISQYKLAKDINVPARRINEIVHGKRSVSADTALRLSRYFNLSERFWLNLKAKFCPHNCLAAEHCVDRCEKKRGQKTVPSFVRVGERRERVETVLTRVGILGHK